MADSSKVPEGRIATPAAGGTLAAVDGTRRWPALAVWLAGTVSLVALDDSLDLANKAQMLVLVSAIASLWSTPWVAVAASALAVLGFNFAFVPPRGTLAVDLHQHTVLLVTMLAVSSIVALLMARQRRLLAQAQWHARRSEQLRLLGERLREADDPRTLAALFRQTLEGATAASAAVLLEAEPAEGRQEPFVDGQVDADERAGLQLCARTNAAMGPGSGRHEEQPCWYLPMRGRRGSLGAALARVGNAPSGGEDARGHAQAMCDQMGLIIERTQALRSAAAARDASRSQALRITVLAAMAHDHRTPLATILGAASSLHDQADRLDPQQRRRLAATIVDEAGQLARLADNTLQLARLDTPGLALRLDWESVEELVGTLLRRSRQRDPHCRVLARVEPNLPLLRCDPLLIGQLLDNLLDNALKYGGNAAAVEIVARRIAGQAVIAVRDRGPGIPVAQRERIFEVFQRGDRRPGGAEPPMPRGAGVGLAVCRAIARAHGGELRLRPRSRGGSAFELWLPSPAPPQLPEVSGSTAP